MVYKCKEWLTAFKIEHVYSKDEILTLYLNTVPFGNNSFGIKTASLKFFNKTPDKVSPAEAATLIGMLKATSTYNPINNPERSMERRNTVLRQMLKYNNALSKDVYDESIKAPVKLDLSYVDNEGQGGSYLRDAIERWLKKWCKDNDYDLYQDGLKIYTTIDPRPATVCRTSRSRKNENAPKTF